MKAQNILLLLWTVVPPVVVIVGAWLFLRAGRRWEERNRGR